MNASVDTRARVLFIDDDPLVLNGFKTAYSRAPFEVLVAQSAEQALERLHSEEIDVMITDERMPGLSGSQLCATLAQEDHPAIRILLTGHASLDTALRAVNEGEVFKILCKPIDPGLLAELISQAVSRRHRQDNVLNELANVLSSREREVAEMLVGGMRIPQISERMHISKHTVRNHLKSMFNKVGVHSQGELVERLKA